VNPSHTRWWQLALLTITMLLGMAVWLAASAVGPVLAASLHLSQGATGWLTSAVQFGFVVGTLIVAILNLADLWSARWLVAGAAVLAAIANAGLLVADSFGTALLSRFCTGLALAGVYPPAMKMASTWFKDRRGLAIGCIVAALTAGKALPYLLSGIDVLSLTFAVGVPSLMALGAAVLVAVGYRDGPYLVPPRPFSWGLAGTVLREPGVRRATGGYLGHMWELYAFWAWIPGFLAASLAAQGKIEAMAKFWAFVMVAVGAAGAVWGGLAADRIGRPRVTRIALVVSGACCILSPLFFQAPFWMLVVFGMVWGVAVIADSAQFSAMVSEFAPPHAVGTALTLQTSIGFLLTIATIQGVPMLAEAVGWQWAMAVLGLGPAAGIWAMRRL
jgi:MFS family permease